jgi:uncharacterized protein YegP (UPF0339 family)
MYFQTFRRFSLKTMSKLWYFRIRAANGEVVCPSEGYKNKADMMSIIATLKSDLRYAEIEEA